MKKFQTEKNENLAFLANFAKKGLFLKNMIHTRVELHFNTKRYATYDSYSPKKVLNQKLVYSINFSGVKTRAHAKRAIRVHLT